MSLSGLARYLYCVAGKFLAFSGPAAQPFQMGSYVTHTPEDYHRYFHHKGVKAIVRLNNQVSKLWHPAR